MGQREIVDIPIDSIRAQILERTPTDQGIIELANSIRQIGIIEPLVVLKTETEYILQAGKRRLMAAKQAGLPTVPCVVVDVDKEGSIAITLQENLYREDLNPVDEAWIYQQLRDVHRYSGQEIARMIGRKEGYVSQRLQIVLWPDNLVKALREGEISFSAAREFAIITDLKHLSWLLKHGINQGVNYRTARRWRIDWQGQVLSETKGADYTKAPPEPEIPQTSGIPCWWCEELKDPALIVTIQLCIPCLTGMQSSKDKIDKSGS